MITKVRFFIVCSSVLFCCAAVRSQTVPDLVIFDEDDPAGAGYYDASYGTKSGASTLTLGGSGDKLIIETANHYSGVNSGLLEWKSVSGGDWGLFVASLSWGIKDASGYDSLVLFVNARGAVAASNLPKIGLESSTNQLSSLLALGDFLPRGIDGDTATWQRVSIPLTAFEPYNLFALSTLKDVNFHQGTADNVLHTVWVDNIRIVSKANAPDTTLPSSPKRVVTRSGDKSVVLHWNLAPENTNAGYSLYRATNAGGPFDKLTSSVLPLPSFADLAVTNAQTYYYYVRGVNSNQVEGGNSDTVTATPQVFANDDAFLNYVEQTSFDYFWYEANPTTGLIKDRSTKNSSSSIAAVGFGLTAIGVGVDRGWITREEGRDRTLITLNTFWKGPQSVLASNMIGYKGWFYHFLDMNTATRAGTCELSSIDTGLLLAGVLYSKQYFSGTDTTETKIRSLADSIYNRVDWNWMRNNAPSLTMGWYPESGSGFIGARWTGYNEAMILYILGMGAPSNPLPASSWNAWTSGYQWFFNNWLADYFVNFQPLFGHQYSHCWVDYRNIADDYMKIKGITYFENSRRATLAQRLYCIDNPRGAVGYGADMWGLTAGDGPTGYIARGTNMNDDGTLSPTAPGGSIAFAPEFCLPALRKMYDQYRSSIWTGYGFTDAFNLTVNWWGPDVIGIDQGPIVIMAENYRTGKVWSTFMKEKIVADGLQRAGFTTITDVAEAKQKAPGLYSLEQNYPNPFNPTTEIRYNLPKQNFTVLKVYDLIGREIATLANKNQDGGEYTVSFDASQLPSGVYFYTLKSGEFFSARKMMLVH